MFRQNTRRGGDLREPSRESEGRSTSSGFPEETYFPRRGCSRNRRAKHYRGSGMIDTTAYPSVVRRRKVRKGREAGNGGHSVYMWIFTIDRLHARRIRRTDVVGLTSPRRRTKRERSEGGPAKGDAKGRSRIVSVATRFLSPSREREEMTRERRDATGSFATALTTACFTTLRHYVGHPLDDPRPARTSAAT